MKSTPILLFILAFLFTACDTAKKAGGSGDDGRIEVVFLQMNDVYEISPMPSDDRGGLARVAALRQELLRKNPNVITVLAGDFISPSVIGTLRYEGKRIRGRHMVETLNALGVDWVVFGNHEFDYDDPADLQSRLDESNFEWLAGNVRQRGEHGAMLPFSKTVAGVKENCPDHAMIRIKDADGTTLDLGLFGVLITTGRKPWAVYSDPFQSAKSSYRQLLAQKAEVVVGLTHLAVEDDLKLSAELPEVPLIMGGHDHSNMMRRVGTAVVAKADANARTVYVHTLRYDKKTRKTTVSSELRTIDAKLPDDPATAAVVAKWEKIKNESLATSGFDPNKKVVDLPQPLDCREGLIRFNQAPAGKMITDAMLAAARNKPDCALLNSGSIRVDDVLSGTLTELDIVRMLPFGGAVVEVEMRGTLLRRTLDAGLGNQDNGGYLQWGRIGRDEAKKTWLVADRPLDDAKTYRVILPEFLLSGNEYNMAFLKTALSADGKATDNPEVLRLLKPNPADKADLRNDIRLAVIGFLRK